MEVDFVTPGVIEDDTVEANNDDVSFEGESCGICMDIIIDRGVLDCCQHWFCFGCIDNWSTITNLCPLCQNEFQSITCVTVYDTIGSNKVDDESFSRNDDWSIEGQSSTLSFPSSYIDENAVICLDGDGCKIRSGMANVEEDSNLDTSIACDSCDVWYHAFCVGFDTENTSEETWLCPRCTVDEVPQKPDTTSVQRPSFQCDPQSSHPNCLTSAAFSGKVSVSVADAGETAIVVSMVRESDWTGKPNENIKPSFEGDEIVKVNVDNPDGKDIKVETLCTEKKGIQEILEPQGLELSLLRDASCIQPQNSNLWVTSELKISCSDEAINETRRFNGVKDSLRKLKGYFDKREQSECESTTGLHLGLSVGCFQSGDTAVDNTNNIRIKGEDPPDRDIQKQNLSDESLSRYEKIQADSSKEAVKIAGLKRRHIDCSDDGEANDKSEDANTVKKKRDEENLQINQSKDQNTSNALPPDSQNCAAQMGPSKDKSNALVTDDSQKCPQIALLKDVKLEQPSEKEVDSDIMSIVQGKIRRTSMGLSLQNPAIKSSKERETVAGLRVKRIMKRASGDKESSVVVQKLRKEIREAVRNKKSADIGESLFDPKLLAAFRAAIAEATVEPSSTRLPPSALKAKKTVLQKGKVRENLTKKIYVDSNGRRKRAWDRECEIEFWKYRCTRATKPEKVATLKSVLNLLRKNPSAEGPGLDGAPECRATSPILCRLYLADTSVFPRKDDIKPLSALTSKSDSEQKRSLLVSGEKCQKTSPENCSPTEVDKVSLKPGVPSVPSKGIQTKVPTMKDKAASSKVLPDRPSEASAQKQTGIQSDGQKIDKRKWALEVLARKKAAGGQTATNEKQEGSIVLKGNFPLLAQLPKDMWPALAASCHNKIPVPVRQTQLCRLTEHFLRKLDLPEICRNADIELAVADAINIEKEIADKSNSKVVYLNLCSQETFRRSDSSKTDRSTESNSSPLLAIPGDRPEQSSSDLPTDPSVLEALRNAGLLSDSPPSSPSHKMEVPYEVDDSPLQSNEEGQDNVFEMDYHPEVDIYGDFEYDLEDEDFIGATAVQVTKLPSEEGESKMKLVFSTLKPEKTVDVLEAEDGGNLGNIKNPESSPSLTGHFDNNSIDSFTEQGTKKSCDKPDLLTGEEGEELSLAECEELYGPDKEPLINKFPEESRKLYGSLDAGAPSENKIPEGNENVVPSQAENNIVANLQEHTCHDEKSSEKSQTSEKVSRKEKTDADNKKHCDTGMADSVSKKVEAYIKEHIRPLCKSGIITPEQYRWAVTKTTDKVMKYHAKDKNANFLIKEGEKVKKLAQQYLEASKQK